MNDRPQRKSPRLQDYDYAQAGAYFITICTHQRQHILGVVRNDVVQLNKNGQIAYQDIEALGSRWDSVEVDMFVVMPNHVHMILVLDDSNNKHHTVGAVIGVYKSGVTRRIRQLQNAPKLRV